MLPQGTLAQLAVWDEYFKDTYRFEARGFEIFIADGLLAEALKTLPASCCHLPMPAEKVCVFFLCCYYYALESENGKLFQKNFQKVFDKA